LGLMPGLWLDFQYVLQDFLRIPAAAAVCGIGKQRGKDAVD
jgi:hypothetical protein